MNIMQEEDKTEFLRCIFEGRTILQSCAFVSIDPMILAQTRKTDKAFDDDIRQAQAFRVDCMADTLMDAHKKWKDAKMAGVMSKNIQWLASKRLREIYGDKVDHNINVQVDIRAAMIAAQDRVLHIMDDKPLISQDSITDNISDAHDVIDLVPLPINNDDEDIDPLS